MAPLRSLAAAAALANGALSVSFAVATPDNRADEATCGATSAGCADDEEMAMLQVAGGVRSTWPHFDMPDLKMPDFHLPETGIDIPGVELPKSPSELRAAVEKMDTGKLKELKQKLEDKLSSGGGFADKMVKSLVDKVLEHKEGSLLATGSAEEFPFPKFKMPDWKLPETGIDLPGIELPKSKNELMAKLKGMGTDELKKLDRDLDHKDFSSNPEKQGLKDKLKGMVEGMFEEKEQSLKQKMKDKLSSFKTKFFR